MLITRRVTSLGVALLLSAGAVMATQQWLQGELKRAAGGPAQSTAAPAVQVLVAKQPLPAGTILKPEHLRWQAWPAEASTEGYFTGAAATSEQMAGAVVRTGLGAGEPLTSSRVVQPGDRSFLAAVLTPGYRAVTVNVSASTGVAGFVFPGDRVDLILTRVGEGGGAQKRAVSETVLSDVRVVGMDQRASNEKMEVVVPQTATLEVTPRQAELVATTSELGKLSLSLRSLPTAAEPAVHAEPAPILRPKASSPRRRAAPSAPRQVQVVRGTQTSIEG